MVKLIVWKDARAKHKSFTINARASSIDDARRLIIGAIAGLVPHTLSEEEGEALLNWAYEKEPVVEQNPSGATASGVSIAAVN